MEPTGEAFRLGRAVRTGDTYSGIEGTLGYVAIWDGVLTPEQHALVSASVLAGNGLPPLT